MGETQNGPRKVARAASESFELGSREDTEGASLSKPLDDDLKAPGPGGIVLRPYQALDIVRMRQRFRDGARRVCYALPTGGGKTIAFAFITWSALRSGRRILILAHRQELIDQISGALTKMAVAHGLIAQGQPQTRWPVQVASVFTIARRMRPGEILPFDLIVIDECHHATASSWRAVLAACPDARILGVTATPARLDGKGLDEIFETLVCGADVATLTRQKFLVPSVVFSPLRLPNLTHVKSRGGDYALDQLAAAMSDRPLVARAVADYNERCAGMPAVAFCVDRRHSEMTAEAFRDAGFRSAHVDGDTDKAERTRRIAALGTGELDVLCNCGLISEGVDVPAIAAAILLRPTQSVALYLQQVGRALRPSPGKERAIILDHAGNALRHGLPDAPRQWSLLAQKRDRRERHSLVRCTACGAVTAPAPFCVYCGAPPRPADGGALNLWLELTKTPGLAGELRRMTYHELLRFADTPEKARVVEFARGFKRGWAWHRARELEGGGPT